MDYLTQEQRYNIAMRLLSIVERMAFGRLAEPKPEPILPVLHNELPDEHDSALNDMIRRQIRIADPEFMASPEELTNEQPHDG